MYMRMHVCVYVSTCVLGIPGYVLNHRSPYTYTYTIKLPVTHWSDVVSASGKLQLQAIIWLPKMLAQHALINYALSSTTMCSKLRSHNALLQTPPCVIRDHHSIYSFAGYSVHPYYRLQSVAGNRLRTLAQSFPLRGAIRYHGI